MSELNQTLTVQLLDKLYHVKCPKEKIPELQQAAIYLDGKMREISEIRNLKSLDRITIMAALNICHELLTLRQQETQFYNTMGNRIQAIQNRITSSLPTQKEEIEL